MRELNGRDGEEREPVLRRAERDDAGWAKVLLAASRQAGKVRLAAGDAIRGFRRPGARPAFEDAERQLAALAGLLGKRERAELVLCRVRNALAALPMEQAGLLRLRYLRRAACTDIAEAFCISRRTVYRRLDAALSAFCARIRAAEEHGERAALLEDGWIRCIAEEVLRV